mmetsp:Transcript_3449/g.13137  ORF Transcript_3449/g.13137 Transcript_3449/m.13137 type:complete len:391 (-) Transcript_3449:1363-2535(-)
MSSKRYLRTSSRGSGTNSTSKHQHIDESQSIPHLQASLQIETQRRLKYEQQCQDLLSQLRASQDKCSKMQRETNEFRDSVQAQLEFMQQKLKGQLGTFEKEKEKFMKQKRHFQRKQRSFRLRMRLWQEWELYQSAVYGVQCSRYKNKPIRDVSWLDERFCQLFECQEWRRIFDGVRREEIAEKDDERGRDNERRHKLTELGKWNASSLRHLFEESLGNQEDEENESGDDGDEVDFLQVKRITSLDSGRRNTSVDELDSDDTLRRPQTTPSKRNTTLPQKRKSPRAHNSLRSPRASSPLRSRSPSNNSTQLPTLNTKDSPALVGIGHFRSPAPLLSTKLLEYGPDMDFSVLKKDTNISRRKTPAKSLARWKEGRMVARMADKETVIELARQ